MTARLIPLVVLLLVGATSACAGSDGQQDKPAPPAGSGARAGFGGRTTTPPTAAEVREVDQMAFVTPSTNIGCFLETTTVRCDIGRKNWAPPAKPANCSLDWGNGVSVNTSKAANFICAGDSLLGSTSVVLPYGHAVRAGAFLCDSELVALHCENTKTGHGFTLSVQDYHLY